MTIRNYNNTPGKESKYLYMIEYESYSEEDNEREEGKIFIIAENNKKATDIFHQFYMTGVPNPDEIPGPSDSTYHREIGGLEKIAVTKVSDVVLVKKD